MGAKWIKLNTDIFDNRKVKYLRSQPEGDSLALAWVMLLALAGKCNAGGALSLTEKVPYTAKTLACELGFPEKFMKKALKLFKELGMVTVEDSSLSITGWEEHQNVEGMDRIREQTRKRVAKHREEKSETEQETENRCNVTESVTGNVTVTQCNATEKEREEEIEKKGKKKSGRFSPPTQDDVKRYCGENGYTVDAEHFVSYYQANGWKVGRNPMKDWKAALRTWERRNRETQPEAQLPCDENNYGYVISPIEDPFETAMRERGYV